MEGCVLGEPLGLLKGVDTASGHLIPQFYSLHQYPALKFVHNEQFNYLTILLSLNVGLFYADKSC